MCYDGRRIKLGVTFKVVILLVERKDLHNLYNKYIKIRKEINTISRKKYPSMATINWGSSNHLIDVYPAGHKGIIKEDGWPQVKRHRMIWQAHRKLRVEPRMKKENEVSR